MQAKLLGYATALEGAAWTGALLAASDSGAFLAFALLHGAAAILAGLALVAVAAPGSRRARLALAPLAFTLLFALPGIGIALTVGWLLALRRLRVRHRLAGFAEVTVPPFDAHLQSRPRFRFAGAAGILANPRVPSTTRVGALLALSRMPGRIATPLLRSVLTCANEDVRLLAYGLLDAREKALNESIHEALRLYAQPEQRLAAAARLAGLYWEMVYHGLAVGDVRRHALERCLAYAEEVLAAGFDAETTLYRARALHALGRYDEAQAAYANLGELPASRVLPYLAELAFDQGDYAACRSRLERLEADAAPTRLAPVLRYWRQA